MNWKRATIVLLLSLGLAVIWTPTASAIHGCASASVGPDGANVDVSTMGCYKIVYYPAREQCEWVHDNPYVGGECVLPELEP